MPKLHIGPVHHTGGGCSFEADVRRGPLINGDKHGAVGPEARMDHPRNHGLLDDGSMVAATLPASRDFADMGSVNHVIVGHHLKSVATDLIRKWIIPFVPIRDQNSRIDTW